MSIKNNNKLNIDNTTVWSTIAPCKIPTNFSNVCPKECKLYPAKWENKVNIDNYDEYCAPYYDPSMKKDCSKCGTVKVITPTQNSKTITWQEKITDKINTLSVETRSKIYRMIKDSV